MEALVATDKRNPPPSSLATRNVMKANRGSGNALERRVWKELRSKGVPRFRTNWPTPAGRADLAFPQHRVAVFIHGCFWHHCAYCQRRVPIRNRSFWARKFAANRARDARVRAQLRACGWSVVELRECQIRRHLDRQLDRIARAVARD